MRTFRIDFTQDNPCLDGCYIGRIGEHNATELIITPPAAMTENEAVTNYIIAFVTGGKQLIHSKPFNKAATFSVPLWKQLTMHPVLGIQLEAYDGAGEYIGKSAYISGLRFLPSASGNDIPADTDNPDLVSDFLKTKHSHKNKKTLDKFSEDDDGNPLYNGQLIGNSTGSGMTEEQAENLEKNTKARHTHGNKTGFVPADEVSYTHRNIQDKTKTVKGALDEAITYVTEVLSLHDHTHNNKNVLEKLTDDNGTLNYDGKPIGGSGSTERPTNYVDITFLEGELQSNTLILGDGGAEIDPLLIGKEIADVEVVRADGNLYSLKKMSDVDYIPHITMLGYLHEGEVNGISETIVAKVYFPAGVNWLYGELIGGVITNARITYYTN